MSGAYMEKGKLANMDSMTNSAMHYNRKIRMFNMFSIRYNTSTIHTQKKSVTIANCTGEYIKYQIFELRRKISNIFAVIHNLSRCEIKPKKPSCFPFFLDETLILNTVFSLFCRFLPLLWYWWKWVQLEHVIYYFYLFFFFPFFSL